MNRNTTSNAKYIPQIHYFPEINTMNRNTTSNAN